MCPPPEMRDEPQSGVGPGELSDTALTLDHENPGFPDGMSDMLRTDSGMEHIARLEDSAVLHAPVSIPHFDPAIEDGKYFLPVIDVPFVWLIRPMKARGDAAHVGDVCRAPGAIRLEGASAKYFHSAPNGRVGRPGTGPRPRPDAAHHRHTAARTPCQLPRSTPSRTPILSPSH